MAANTSPIFAITPNCGAQNVILSGAATSTKAFDGTEAVGTTMGLIFTAGLNGSRVDQVKIKYSATAATAASGTSTATVVRIFLNNGSVNTTAANNILWGEIAVPAQLYSNVALMPEFILTVGISLFANWRIYALNTTAVGGTNCALAVSASGGDY